MKPIEKPIEFEPPDPRLISVIRSAMEFWDAKGQPYPEHLQAAVDQFGLGRDKTA